MTCVVNFCLISVVQEVSFEWENTCPYWCLYSRSAYRLSLVYTYLLTIHTERWLTIYVVQTSPAGLYEGCTCITELEIVLSTCSGRQEIWWLPSVVATRFFAFFFFHESCPSCHIIFSSVSHIMHVLITTLNSYDRNQAVHDILRLIASFVSLAGCLLWSSWICFFDRSHPSCRAIITVSINHHSH
jgi:hypothetical protein